MKLIRILTLLVGLFVTYSALAQPVSEALDTKKHRVIIQFNANDSLSQTLLVHQLDYLRTSWPNSAIEVVCSNDGLDVLLIAASKVRKEISEWAAKGVVFAACNSTMRRRNVHRSDLLPDTKIVPSAPVELSLRQEQGWAYFRGGD